MNSLDRFGQLWTTVDNLKNILEQILKSTPNYEDQRAKGIVFEAWPKIVGDRVAKHCWPIKLFDDGLLLIAAESSVWLQSLRYLEAQIVEKYEKELKSKKIKGLRFKLESPKK